MAAAAANAQAALRWLKRQPPNVEEALLTLDEITNNTARASEIIGRIRALVTKAPQRKESFEINEAIREVITLGQTEVRKNGVSLPWRGAKDCLLSKEIVYNSAGDA